ncbi:hypothetical protein PJO47_29320, partial [Mycobacterium kansasii]
YWTNFPSAFFDHGPLFQSANTTNDLSSAFFEFNLCNVKKAVVNWVTVGQSKLHAMWLSCDGEEGHARQGIPNRLRIGRNGRYIMVTVG